MAEGRDQAVEEDPNVTISLGLLEEQLFKIKCKSCDEPIVNHRELKFCLFDSGGTFISTEMGEMPIDNHAYILKLSMAMARKHDLSRRTRLKKVINEVLDGNGRTEVGSG